LLPLLQATPGSRVVTMSSMGARLGHVDLGDLGWERRPYDRWQAYFQSKLANLLFTFELERRLRAGRAAGAERGPGLDRTARAPPARGPAARGAAEPPGPQPGAGRRPVGAVGAPDRPDLLPLSPVARPATTDACPEPGEPERKTPVECGSSARVGR